MAPIPAQTNEAAIDTDARCVSCGYSLIGLPVSGVCPECGTAVVDSTVGLLLQYSSHEHLKKLHRGVVFIVAGSVAGLLVVLLGVSVEITLLGATALLLPEVEFAITLLQFLVAVPLLYGWWLFSTPDETYGGEVRGERSRRVVRATVAIQAATLLPAYLASASTPILTAVMEEAEETDDIVGLLAIAAISLAVVLLILAYLAAIVTQFFASMLYTGALGQRMPNSKVVKRAKTLMWLSPVLLTFGLLILIGPFIAIVLYCSMFNWIRKDLKRIRKTKLDAELTGLTASYTGV